MLRIALLILAGNATSSLFLLARNLVVARIIPVADYGVASTFAVLMAVVEMTSALGLQKQIVQAQDGDDPRFQAGLQGFQVLRGFLSGLIVFMLAAPLARFMGIPEVAWAYKVLALVPVVNALQHFDIHRLNRQMRFGPLLLSTTVPALAALLVVWPLASWMGDWRVMLWSILLQSALMAAVSHVLAERTYRLVFDKVIVLRSLRFGWPLLLNAVLLFLVFQGDKLIVGHVLGMENLAVFAMGVTLTLTPTLVLAKSAQNLFLPLLSAVPTKMRSDQRTFDRMAHATLQAAILNGAAVILAMALAGNWLIEILLGERYQQLGPIIASFALLHGLRVLKAGTAVVALSRGQTGNAMVANIPRVAVLPLGWWLLENNGTLTQLIWLGVGAELAGYVISLWMIRRYTGVNLSPMRSVGLWFGVFLVACYAPFPEQNDASSQLRVLAMLLSFPILFATMREFRYHVFARIT